MKKISNKDSTMYVWDLGGINMVSANQKDKRRIVQIEPLFEPMSNIANRKEVPSFKRLFMVEVEDEEN